MRYPLRSFVLMAAVLTLLVGLHPAQAQTLSLTPAFTTTASGSTVTFAVVLSGGTNDTSALGAYDFTASVDPHYLTFANPGTPFTINPSAGFESVFVNSADNTTGVLNISCAVDFTDPAVNVASNGTLTLGTFTTNVVTSLPGSGVSLVLGPVGTGDGQSAVQDANTYANVLTGVSNATLSPPVSVPEPSELLTLGIGLLLIGAAARRRRDLRQTLPK